MFGVGTEEPPLQLIALSKIDFEEASEHSRLCKIARRRALVVCNGRNARHETSGWRENTLEYGEPLSLRHTLWYRQAFPGLLGKVQGRESARGVACIRARGCSIIFVTLCLFGLDSVLTFPRGTPLPDAHRGGLCLEELYLAIAEADFHMGGYSILIGAR